MAIVVREKKQLMSASEIDRTLVRLAHEILEKTDDLEKLAFIGIRRRGAPLAHRLAAKIKQGWRFQSVFWTSRCIATTCQPSARSRF
jgi:pyrimidine operon attenuation protein/uracil phosphoribosyltransferase